MGPSYRVAGPCHRSGTKSGRVGLDVGSRSGAFSRSKMDNDPPFRLSEKDGQPNDVARLSIPLAGVRCKSLFRAKSCCQAGNSRMAAREFKNVARSSAAVGWGAFHPCDSPASDWMAWNGGHRLPAPLWSFPSAFAALALPRHSCEADDDVTRHRHLAQQVLGTELERGVHGPDARAFVQALGQTSRSTSRSVQNLPSFGCIARAGDLPARPRRVRVADGLFSDPRL